MKIDDNHLLSEVRQVPSSHCDLRPDSDDISLLVIHHISLPPFEYGSEDIEAFFTGTLDPNRHAFFKVIEKMRVSAHCLIRRDGEIIQFVPFDKRAWHAGISSFAGRDRCNDYSIGIELEGSEFDAYTPSQYLALAKLSQLLMSRYDKISPSRITGHQFISPLRKSDPGLTFDWPFYRSLLK
ncbi:1,6-anhydro-N-acetylmuramyl-L-alanine amidase AmpD [Vibrio sp. SCSIO 43136]|uniref:1,6-anhydro-N-acetylmuramyl-L-alanine amidase AmpD n=1 Tax=Vibrio sp. SCSIO 43136 TaxID=2819101 RepID=UPI002075D58A|nr:1,6-anhydro-N-acetylmuramyl-L-alanine amidase AmpD [Vibrio sp. SCSIO 43136]USD64851.1 1,6-anhydro-N-acetylmuramyl-L-alanine amidase AmpD [Vibrio sp. SCSIO 43136]